MNKSLFVLLGLLSSIAHAESAAEMTLPESEMPADMVSETVIDPELDANNNDFYEGRFAIEVNSRVNGSTSGNIVESNQSSNNAYTNGIGFAVSGRYFVDHEQALTFSIPVYAISKSNTRDLNDGERVGYNDITIAPLLFGYRYQFSSIGNSSLFRPYLQAEAGLVLSKIYDNSNSYYTDARPTSTSSALGFKPSAGVDAFLSKRSPVYFGIQTGYLFTKAYGNSEFALNLGTQL